MTRIDALTLVDYHYWARDRACDAVRVLSADQFTRDLGNSFPSVRDTLAHIYGAEWIWLARWHGESPTALPSPRLFADLPSLLTAWTEQEVRMRAFVESLDDEGLRRAVQYKTTGGSTATSPMWQMVQHVVNHASYHRGQVTTMLRQLGAAPPKSQDLITFYRERSA